MSIDAGKTILVVAALVFCAHFARADRREVTILRVPNDLITIDARDDDWHRIPSDALARCGAVSNDGRLWQSLSAERGVWEGPSDCAMKVQLAADDDNLYVLAEVRDQFLINTAKPNEVFFGDDFEIFVEAGPPDARFAAKSDNYRQFIFVPTLVNSDLPGTFIWQSDRNPGVVAASRLRPGGYAIEVKIPKSLFPYWRSHAELDSIGLDLLLSDADGPGVDCLHPATKGALYLLDIGSHFQTPEKIGLAKLEPTAVTPSPATTQATATSQATTSQPTTTTTATSTPPATTTASDPLVEAIKLATLETVDAWAQALLDRAADDQIAPLVAEAMASQQIVLRKVGAFIAAQRPTIDVPIETLVGIVRATSATTRPADTEGRQYALIALARRQKLPADALFDTYTAPSAESGLRLTFLWCVGINGDKTIAPKLIALLTDPNLRVRMMAAMALGMLRDASAVDALKMMAEKDSHQYAQVQAKLALEQISKGK